MNSETELDQVNMANQNSALEAISAPKTHIQESVHVEDSISPVSKEQDVALNPSEMTRPIPLANLSEHDKRLMRRLLWKIDLWILPVVAVIYFLASLDRTDIGNVQVAGMQKAVHAAGRQWAQVVSLFYIGYVLSQPIGAIGLRRMTPPVVISVGILCWGVCTTCLMAVNTWQQAVAVRIFLGAGEGFIHAASGYLSLWYGPRELASRGAIYFSTSTLAGAFNGLVAYAIVKHVGNRPPFSAWQWILLIEGVITLGWGLIVLVVLPPVPERVRWGFTKEEKRLLVIRTWEANNTPNATFKWSQVHVTFRDPMFYSFAVIFSACQIALTSLGSFLPAIIKSMQYSSVEAQLMTVPVYACAFVLTIAFGFIADRYGRRGLCIAMSSSFSLLGYIMLIASKNPGVRYAGVCIASAGQYPIPSLSLGWLAFNTRSWTHRVTAGTLVPMIGQAAALAGLQGFDTPPFYLKGNSVALAVVCVMPPVALLTSWYYARENRKKDARMHTAETALQRQKSLEELGHKHPDFRYFT